VVGGHLGVFEGNGGDLRIGLPLQSVLDGENWIHQPLRLTVVVAAPKDVLQRLVKKNEVLRQLFGNGWAYLCHWDENAQKLERYDSGVWRAISSNS